MSHITLFPETGMANATFDPVDLYPGALHLATNRKPLRG